MVVSAATAFGAMVSSTVMCACAVSKLPAGSVPVKIMVTGLLVFEQSKMESLSDKVKALQLSVEPASTSAFVMLTVPLLSR